MFDPIEAVKEYIRHPSISTDPEYKAGMEGARNHIAGILKGMGCEVEIVPAALHPLVFAQRKGDPSWPHIIIYGHYDVQPAEPIEKWDTPPFEPVIKDGKLYARGAADNKGPQMVHVAAAARLLEKHPDLPLRLSFLIEGEEEIGSPSFPDILARLGDRLDGDFILLSDTQSPSAEQIAITCGIRGIICVNAELTGPKSDLHSGIHGGALLNPLQALVDLCASLHTPDGRVNIPGFYDAVIPPVEWERAEVAKLPGTTEDYRKSLDIPAFHTIDGLTPQEATRFMPTLEFNGMGGGYQGAGTKTVIPSKAILKISCRLVANQDPATIEALVIKTLEERCSKKVKLSIQREHSGTPYRVVPPDRSDTPADQNKHLAAAFRATDKAITEVYGIPPLYTKEGGSVPIIADLKRVTGMDSLMIGMFTPDSNLHAPNENLNLGMFLKGIDMSERILAEVAGITL